MNNARVIRMPASRTAGKATGKASSGRTKTKWIVAAMILLLMAVAAWAYMPQGKDPNLAMIEQLREQMDGATDDQRRELWGQMREAYRNLPEDARRQLWEAREQEFLNKFFAMTPTEQIEKIDEQLKEEEERRKQWAQRRAQQSDRGARDGGRRGGRGGRGSRDSVERRKNYLDRTSPQTRAQRSEYRRLRDARRQALGMPNRRR
jgi:hypothetical protein